MEQLVILIAGPTGVGKTDFVEIFVDSLHKKNLNKKFSIINADVGQFYGPISIGTAKPENLEPGKHYLFGIINEPKEINVTQYRKMVLDNVEQSFLENKIPIIVGGSGFYLRSLFYLIEEPASRLRLSTPSGLADYVGLAPLRPEGLISKNKTTQELWQELEKIDPVRAQKIPNNDRYRIERALDIWYSTGVIPSSFKPKLDIPFKFKFIYLTRSRPELYNIIDSRVIKMLQAGWIEEVKNLDKTWLDFLKIKKIIGYPEIIEYLDTAVPALISTIQQKTRNYAKRQETFFRQLVRDLNIEVKDSAIEYNLTLSTVDLYIDELVKVLNAD